MMKTLEIDRLEIVEESHQRLRTESVPHPVPLTVEVVCEMNAFAVLHDEWNAVVEASSATVFQTFEWAFLWWKHFGMHRNRSLHILVYRHHGRVVGIAPLFLEVSSFAGLRLYRRLRFLGCAVTQRESVGILVDYDPTDYLDIIGLPDYESAIACSLASYLQSSAALYDEVTLTNVPRQSFVLRRLVPQLSRHGLQYTMTRAAICPRVQTLSSIEAYCRGRNPHVRHRLSQTRRAFTGSTAYSIQTIHSAESFPEGFRDLVTFHQQRWNRLGYPGLFFHARFRRFQEEVAELFLERGWLWFKSVCMNGTRIAARLGFKFNNRFYDYLSGFDEDSPGAKRRPGLALLLSMIEDAIHARIPVVDFLRGDEQYKFELTSEFTDTWNVILLNPNMRRACRVRLYQVLRWGGWIGRRVSKEWLLVWVHYQTHGLPAFLVRYLVFRVTRLLRKTLDLTHDPGSLSVSG